MYVVIHSFTGAASSPWSRLGNSGEPTETTETHNGERAGRTRVPRLQRAFCFLTSLQGTYVPVRTVMFYQSIIKKVKARVKSRYTTESWRCNGCAATRLQQQCLFATLRSPDRWISLRRSAFWGPYTTLPYRMMNWWCGHIHWRELACLSSF